MKTCSEEEPFAANDLSFDKSGKTLAIACEDKNVKMYGLVWIALLSLTLC